MAARAAACRPCWLLTLLVLFASVGCSDGAPTADGPRSDLSVAETIRPPDFAIDGGSDLSAQQNIGAPCDPVTGGAECRGDAVCLDLHAGQPASCDLTTGLGCGICALAGCVVEDVETPEVEDTCPEVSFAGTVVRTVCTPVPLAGGGAEPESGAFCLPSCTPAHDTNPCAAYGHAGVTCDPGSVALTGQREVCLYPTCTRDADCDNPDPLDPRATCHLATGMCLTLGSAAGAIGQPCVTSLDCGRYQGCLHEQTTAAGAVQFEGGYCTLIGCEYFVDAATTPFWQCPAGSQCVFIGSSRAVSLCLAYGCDLAAPKASDGCRDEAAPGQYACVQVDDPDHGVCWLDVSTN